MPGGGQFVTPSHMEALLARIEPAVPGSPWGLFGPESASWRVNREAAIFLGAGRAALLQLAHPWVAAALAEHSRVLEDPIARFHNTFRVVFTMIFGTREQALAGARGLHTLHTRIQGELPHAVGRWPQGAHYEANHIPSLRWVYATLVESALIAHDSLLPALAPADRDRYYSETKILAALFGIPPDELPPDWPAFEAYCAAMATSDELGVTPEARAMAANLLRGAGSWLRPPRWYRALTAIWMPDRLRSAFALDVSARDRRAADRALRILPRVYHHLPGGLRFVGPYREARARLAGQPPGITIGWSNRFWMGHDRMPGSGPDRPAAP
jgi:uncharacterized protein (DUF2236 family)